MAKLRNTVIVNGVAYEPGTTPPKEIAEQITNPAAWDDEVVTTADPATEEPPRAGAGSTTEAWRTYATNLGLDVPDDAGRDDIIAAVDAR